MFSYNGQTVVESLESFITNQKYRKELAVSHQFAMKDMLSNFDVLGGTLEDGAFTRRYAGFIVRMRPSQFARARSKVTYSNDLYIGYARDSAFKETFTRGDSVEGTDEERNEGNGVYTISKIGDADPGWICYIVAQK